MHVVRYQKVKKSDTAGFFEKWLDHPISRKTCIFEGFFEVFSETTLTILVLKRQNVEENSTKQTQKTAGLNLFKKLRYLTSKFVIDGPKSSNSAIFGLFSKNRIEILLLKRQNVEEMDSEQMQKTAGLILFKKSRYITILHVSGGTRSQNLRPLEDKSYRKRL